MEIVLFAAAIAILIVAVSPAFASSPADDPEQGYSVYPPVGECHLLKEQVVLPNGHVVFLTPQVCH